MCIATSESKSVLLTNTVPISKRTVASPLMLIQNKKPPGFKASMIGAPNIHCKYKKDSRLVNELPS